MIEIRVTEANKVKGLSNHNEIWRQKTANPSEPNKQPFNMLRGPTQVSDPDHLVSKDGKCTDRMSLNSSLLGD